MLFRPKPPEERRTLRVPVRVTQKEKELIEHAADIRCMDTSEFMRRAALGRRADVRYEHKIVLALREVCDAISRLHHESVAKGLNPDKESLAVVIEEAIAAMQRISK